jgi:hypothetical protein
MSEVIVTGILDSDHLPIMFNIVDPARMSEALNPVEKLRAWKSFKASSPNSLSSNIQIHNSDKVNKAAFDFAASIVSVYMLSTRKSIISELKYEIPGLDRLRKHKVKF